MGSEIVKPSFDTRVVDHEYDDEEDKYRLNDPLTSAASNSPPPSCSSAVSKSPPSLCFTPTSNSASLWSDPPKDALSKRSHVDPKPYEEEWYKERRSRAMIALEYYNKKNNTDYELVDPLGSKIFPWFGLWLHCNFTAKPPNDDISPKLFFAEMLQVECAWTAKACFILEGQATTEGCDFCKVIIHPIDGFSQGNLKCKKKEFSPFVDCLLSEYEKRCRRAEISLEYYNKENGTNYELFDALLSNDFSSEGKWYHCNFIARQDKNTQRVFFAEMSGELSSDSPTMESLTVTACLNLEGLKILVGCALCPNVIHPTCGFHKGVSKSKLDTIDLLDTIDSKVERKGYPESGTSAFPCEDKAKVEDKMSEGNRMHAKMALECYNKQNGTNFELVDTLLCKDLCIWDEGTWIHLNFTAKPLNVDISPKFFFAEKRYDARNDTWTFEACLILEGKTTDGCNHCRGVIHPIDGFRKGNRKSSRKGLPPIIDCSLPETDKWRTRAEIALEYYNEANHTDYELVEVIDRNAFSPNGTRKSASNQNFDETWYHFNFFAWHNEDGKYIDRVFFAEMSGEFSEHNFCMMETLKVTACSILESHDLDTISGCHMCFGVIHPTNGFRKGGILGPKDLGLNVFFSSSDSVLESLTSNFTAAPLLRCPNQIGSHISSGDLGSHAFSDEAITASAKSKGDLLPVLPVVISHKNEVRTSLDSEVK